jgi:hypothetical protein
MTKIRIISLLSARVNQGLRSIRFQAAVERRFNGANVKQGVVLVNLDESGLAKKWQ